MTKRLTRIALFGAIALIIFMVENAFPPLMPFAPGAKLGLSNAVILTAVVLLGYTDALAVVLVKLLFGAIFSGNISALLYSVPAALSSYLVMVVLYEFLFRVISIPGISMLSAVVFNAVQLGIAGWIAGVNLMAVLPVMLLAGIIAGPIVGLTAWLVIRYIPTKIIAN